MMTYGKITIAMLVAAVLGRLVLIHVPSPMPKEQALAA